MSISGRVSSRQNTFCIQYWPFGTVEQPKVLRRINKNGIVISTKKYSEVFFYTSLQDTWEDRKWLMDHGFDIKVRKCCRGRNDKFWLM